MIPAHMKTHKVTIEDYLGTGSYGDEWGSPRTVKCWVEEENKLVTNNLGEQEVSTTQVFVDVGEEAVLKSVVTVNGQQRQIIKVARRTSGGLTVLDHVELLLR